MALSQSEVLVRGLVSVPIVVALFWTVNNIVSRSYRAEQAAKKAAEAKQAASSKKSEDARVCFDAQPMELRLDAPTLT